MLIKALCDYYDLLALDGKILPEGYSRKEIHYLISLTADGKIDALIDYQEKKEIPAAKGKVKEKLIPREVILPQRTEKTAIESNIIEHRPQYLFGLSFDPDNGVLTTEDITGKTKNQEQKKSKAKKSHEAFVEKNIEFIEGLDSPVINAYRNFLKGWKPEEETENSELLKLGKKYGQSNFAFCLTGHPDELLQDDELIRRKWESKYQEKSKDDEQGHSSQCAVSGEEAPIARIHSKIKGVYGGHATGSVLIGYNNDSENSYGKEQSYNSNISEGVMKKYTEALNLLLRDDRHKVLIDDITVVFWAMNTNRAYEDIFMAMLYGQSEKMDAAETEHMLKDLFQSGKKGTITQDRLQSLHKIDTDVDFYILGLKPNSSRLSVKFIYRKKFADILWNIAQFQKDLQISEEWKPISISRIKSELLSPMSSSEKINPALLTKLLEAVLYGTPYPVSLLETTVRRVKTDKDKSIYDKSINGVRAGIIKACLNRNYKKEEFSVSLDKDNKGQAYLCGRLFAVLEKLQQDASNNSLNRTIKDAYFASASSKPAIIFPKLLKLAQNHLNKVKSPVFYNKLIGEIMDKLEGEFPETLLLQDQGRFMIGYYQQYQQDQSFFEKNKDDENDNLENNETEEK